MNPSDKASGPENLEDAHWDDSDISTAPFTEQRAYGGQLWKRPIQFVPASSQVPSIGISRGQLVNPYTLSERNGPSSKSTAYPTCGICGGPLKEANERDHFLSPAHQLALPEMHTPSGIDRTRLGLKVLERHGFDVDARKGLGADGQGMLFPIVPKEKRDKLGLGVNTKLVERREKEKEELAPKKAMLDAGKVRKLADVEKKRHAQLQNMFYGDDRLDRYLGGGSIDHGLK